MKYWQQTFDKLDTISRSRALTESESMLLEVAIQEIDNASKVERARAWSEPEDARLIDLVRSGVAIKEAGRRIGRSPSGAVARYSRLRERGVA